MPLIRTRGDLHEKAARALLRAAFSAAAVFRFRRYTYQSMSRVKVSCCRGPRPLGTEVIDKVRDFRYRPKADTSKSPRGCLCLEVKADFI